jgi:hypothetical protein
MDAFRFTLWLYLALLCFALLCFALLCFALLCFLPLLTISRFWTKTSTSP